MFANFDISSQKKTDKTAALMVRFNQTLDFRLGCVYLNV